MSKIIIANNDTPNMHAVSDIALGDIAKISSRALWFAEAGDILVIPQMFSATLLSYAARIQKRTLDSLTVISRDQGTSTDVRGLTPGELTAMSEAIQAAMGKGSSWSVLFYNATHDVKDLADALGLGETEAVRPFIAEGGTELLNDKRMFRNLVAGRGIPLAPGITANGRHELEHAVRKYLPLTDTVIIKQDRHQGGYGNLIVSTHADGPKLGASAAFVVGTDGTLSQICDTIWNRLAMHRQSQLVVESYCPAAHVLTSEFRCTPSRNKVEFLNWGELRQAPTFSGLIMPPTLPAYLGAKFVAVASEVARLCTDLGYDGLVNIDGIATEDGGIVMNEFNARIGACSHMHKIAETVAGAGYGDRLVMTSYVLKHGCIDRAIEVLDAYGLHFGMEGDEGIVITYGRPGADDNQLEFLTLAADADRALQIEHSFIALLTNSMQQRAA